MRLSPSIVSGILAAAIAACQSTEPLRGAGKKTKAKRAELAASEVLTPETKLPETFGKPLATGKPGLVQVPSGMLLVSEIARPRAELRTGPGIQFELADKILTQGTKV